MAKNLRIDSTDSKAERDYAALQPYTTVSVTVATARHPIRRPDGGTEAAEPHVETNSKVVPGRELMENAAEYDRRVQEFKKQQPNFSALVDQPTEIPLASHNQILRMRNGPEIALFLSFAPEVCSALCRMDAVKAAETIEDISDDLDWGNIPTERITKVTGHKVEPNSSLNGLRIVQQQRHCPSYFKYRWSFRNVAKLCL
jgi:hypothetical protein